MSIHFYAPGEESTRRPDSDREGWNVTTTPIRPVITPDGPGRRVGVGADANKLWAGGAASALIAGLMALTGVLVSRWLFNLPVLAPRQDARDGQARGARQVDQLVRPGMGEAAAVGHQQPHGGLELESLLVQACERRQQGVDPSLLPGQAQLLG
jgi:hypothetical protein